MRFCPGHDRIAEIAEMLLPLVRLRVSVRGFAALGHWARPAEQPTHTHILQQRHRWLWSGLFGLRERPALAAALPLQDNCWWAREARLGSHWRATSWRRQRTEEEKMEDGEGMSKRTKGGPMEEEKMGSDGKEGKGGGSTKSSENCEFLTDVEIFDKNSNLLLDRWLLLEDNGSSSSWAISVHQREWIQVLTYCGWEATSWVCYIFYYWHFWYWRIFTERKTDTLSILLKNRSYGSSFHWLIVFDKWKYKTQTCIYRVETHRDDAGFGSSRVLDL